MTVVEFELVDGKKLHQKFNTGFTEIFRQINRLMITNGSVMVDGHLVAASQIKSLRPLSNKQPC
ncbi:hypothetical protein [Liquorilactobacillus nagelii]|uniref:hypothetical protein n=1 Tax=Liquorilactobacillus nagelii TaxID=82688 RepID=UPI001CCEC522|nr:hypothetical protein [Liquorilactobacillus nagelii]ULQ48866.1 hypothetical protein J6864_07720 [Liquorilactobacillus nagelii]